MYFKALAKKGFVSWEWVRWGDNCSRTVLNSSGTTGQSTSSLTETELLKIGRNQSFPQKKKKKRLNTLFYLYSKCLLVSEREL